MLERPEMETAASGQRVRFNFATPAQEEGIREFCLANQIKQIFDVNYELYVYNKPLPIDIIRAYGGEVISQALPSDLAEK